MSNAGDVVKEALVFIAVIAALVVMFLAGAQSTPAAPTTGPTPTSTSP